MKKQPETFESLIRSFENYYDLRTVFDDFLTMALCAFSQNPLTGLSHDEELYLKTIDRYKDDRLRWNFPKMLTCLTDEIEDRLDSSQGNDVLGDFYQENLYRKGASQYFTPWPVCQLMASMTISADETTARRQRHEGDPLRILDNCCGSGRLLLAGSAVVGPHAEVFGIDADHTCVKMTAINLFLNGRFKGEIMWADALRPDNFQMSYKLSFLPFGIFRITDKHQSRLWYAHVSGFSFGSAFGSKKDIFENEPWASESKNGNSGTQPPPQLNLF
jgi:type I restriction-modification system DNA methylase subunit